MEGKVVLITGAARGIGAACAVAFARKKCNIILNYNSSEKEAYSLKEKLEQEFNVKVLTIKADVSNEEEVKSMIDTSMNYFGTIDILVNNAGIAIDCLFHEKTVENFQKTMDVNVIGTFLMSKYVGEIMYEQKRGHIINLSSTNGIDKYYPMSIDYDASKAAIISLTHNLAYQFSPYVHVNAVAPGWVATENEIKDLDLEYIESEQSKIFLQRFGKPEEIASVIVFLASDEANYINGAIIPIDGGH